MKTVGLLLKRVVHYYNGKQLPLASAALSYYMLMTFFPLIICLYTMLGNNYIQALSILSFAEDMLSASTVQSLRLFINYVARNHSSAMFAAGLIILLSSASAAVRSIEATLGRMQGGKRFTGLKGFLFSLVYAIIFLIVIWFAILVMFTSRDLLRIVNEQIPFVDISGGWQAIKYILLGGMLFLFLWGMFGAARNRKNRFITWPGALVGTLGMLGVSFLFSVFFAVSARYSLVYGSLSSMVLLMLWMFFSGQAMYIGAAFNVALRDLKEA